MCLNYRYRSISRYKLNYVADIMGLMRKMLIDKI